MTRSATEPRHRDRLPHRLVDIDGDGESDVVLQFRTEASGIECGDTTAGLTGLTFDGREFAGRDAIDLLDCHGRGHRSNELQRTQPRR